MVGLLIAQTGLYAQGRGGRGGGAAQPQNAKAAAPFDLTGYWVSIVTEDWRYRMVTPSLGDYQGVPMTPEAIKVANSWDPAKEAASGDACKSYGAPALLRVPGRIHITWLDDETLKLEMDAGKQTRLFHFGDWKPLGGPPSLQGDSKAEWVRGFLRKNGVPYSERTELTEYFDLIKEPDGTPLIVVTVVTTDPMYLRQPFVITSQFKKEPSDAKWKPSECSATW